MQLAARHAVAADKQKPKADQSSIRDVSGQDARAPGCCKMRSGGKNPRSQRTAAAVAEDLSCQDICYNAWCLLMGFTVEIYVAPADSRSLNGLGVSAISGLTGA